MGILSFLGEVVKDYFESNRSQIWKDVVELEEMLDKEINGGYGEFKDDTRDMYVKYIEKYARRIPGEKWNSDDGYRLGTWLSRCVSKLNSLCQKAGLEFDADSLRIEIQRYSDR